MFRAGRDLKNIVYGANDGIITTFAVVAGVAGASLHSSTIILLGIANLFADGFSMAASYYLGAKSERDFLRRESRIVEQDISNAPEEEKHEMTQLLRERGYNESDAETLGKLLFKNKEFFTDLMMQEELEVSRHADDHVSRGALLTFVSFIAAGLIPLSPFLVLQGFENLFAYSVFATGGTLFVVGSLRALFTKRSWFFSGLEMLFVGGVAAAIAYSIGAFLNSVIRL